MKSLSLMVQSNSFIASKVPRNIDECCAVIDVLAIVPGDAINKLNENLKVEDGTVSYRDIKLNKPAGSRATDIDDMPGSYQVIYTSVFTNIIDVVQKYLCHRFKDF